jgi:hypothetical protein
MRTEDASYLNPEERPNERARRGGALMSLTDIAVLVVVGMVLIPVSVIALAAEYRGKRGDCRLPRGFSDGQPPVSAPFLG